jgi:hypothetical protein
VRCNEVADMCQQLTTGWAISTSAVKHVNLHVEVSSSFVFKVQATALLQQVQRLRRCR